MPFIKPNHVVASDIWHSDINIREARELSWNSDNFLVCYKYSTLTLPHKRFRGKNLMQYVSKEMCSLNRLTGLNLWKEIFNKLMLANLVRVIKWGTRVKKITSSAFNARDLLDVTFWQSSPVHLDSDKSFRNWISPSSRWPWAAKMLVFIQIPKCICASCKMYLSIFSSKSVGNWISLGCWS